MISRRAADCANWPAMSRPPPLPAVTLVGYPFRSTGRAEHIRAIWRALAAAGVTARILDVASEAIPEDPGLVAEFGAHLTDTLPPGIRLFHLNGEEVAPDTLGALSARYRGQFAAGHNIVFPAWELPRYPAEWTGNLGQFDEVWAASRFAYNAIRPGLNVLHIPNACEPHITAPLERGHFGIPPDRFAILFAFDFWSFPARKNPRAVIETFRRLRAARPHADVQLVLKFNHSSHRAAAAAEIVAAAAVFGDRLTLIDATLSDNEAKHLTRCCDCYLSLHRSEGFGRGPAEAMFFGKPVIATGWSGNMEYMREDNSLPVRYRLIPVGAHEYPFGANQVWADPDVAHAAELLIRLVDDPAYAKSVGERARRHMQEHFSDAALGARYRARFEAIAAGKEF